MTSQDIERRLRLPAPDEPAVLPALILPSMPSAGFGAVRGRVHAGSVGQPIGIMSPRLAVALLALVVAMVAAIASGALRLDRLPRLLDADGVFAGRGIELTYPADWARLTPADPFDQSGASVALIVANTDVAGCSEAELPPPSFGVAQPTEGSSHTPTEPQYNGPVEDRMLACLVEKPLRPGEVRLYASQGIPQIGGIGPIELFDHEDWGGMVPGESYTGSFLLPSEADGWTHLIDGMPAKLAVTANSGTSGADEVRTWAVVQPGRLDSPWFIRATMRGPELEVLRTQADAVARSLRFDTKPPELDEAKRDGALAAAIDHLDRQYREYPGTRLFACFPRTAGERATRLEYGPGGPLLEPVDVTCRTTVERTPLRLWRGTVVVAWPGGEGNSAGEWGAEIFFGVAGRIEAMGQLQFDPTGFPGTVGEPPPPLAEPLVIPVGSVVELLPPGINQGGPAYQALYQNPDAAFSQDVITEGQPGRRFLIVEGPVSNEGTDWYRVDQSQEAMYPFSFGWLPAGEGGRPLLRMVEPGCPTGEPAVADLLALIPGERLRCFGSSEITLDPVIATLAEPWSGGEVDGTPGWLAKNSRWRLFGADGPSGVEPALAVAISPEVGETLPLNVWLSVRGHFDDAAAATCTRSNPKEWGLPDEPPAIQTLRCRHLFVVTSVERRQAP